MTGQERFVFPNPYRRLDEAEEKGRREAREPDNGRPPYNPYRIGTVLWKAFNEAYKAERNLKR